MPPSKTASPQAEQQLRVSQRQRYVHAMDGWAYSPLKVFHHQDRISQLRRSEQIAPAQAQLIISDLCNQNCNFCAYRMSGYTSNQLFGVRNLNTGKITNNPRRMIAYPKVLEILDDCAAMGVKAIQFTGGGEPTVHPHCEDILQAALDRRLEIALVSNGARLSSRTIDLLLRAKWVRFSIDAGNADTYSSVRRVRKETFETVWRNIKALVHQKKQAKSDVTIGIGFVVTRDNWRDVQQCATTAKSAGVDNLRISAVFQSDNEMYFDDFYDEARDLCKECEQLADSRFRVFNLFGDRLTDLAQHSPDYDFCGYQQFNTFIGADLNVYRCCVYSYNTRGLLGSIKERRFKTLWFSDEKKQLVDGFDATSCERCQFNGKNRTILYAISHNPAHVNFV